jgi:hypothetical protein
VIVDRAVQRGKCLQTLHPPEANHHPIPSSDMSHGSHPAPPDLCREDRPEPAPAPAASCFLSDKTSQHRLRGPANWKPACNRRFVARMNLASTLSKEFIPVHGSALESMFAGFGSGAPIRIKPRTPMSLKSQFDCGSTQPISDACS